jgi:hypothetical protein
MTKKIWKKSKKISKNAAEVHADFESVDKKLKKAPKKCYKHNNFDEHE